MNRQTSTIRHLCRKWNFWSLRCGWSIACRRFSNYILILDSTPGFNVLDRYNCKTRQKTKILGLGAPYIWWFTVIFLIEWNAVKDIAFKVSDIFACFRAVLSTEGALVSIWCILTHRIYKQCHVMEPINLLRPAAPERFVKYSSPPRSYMYCITVVSRWISYPDKCVPWAVYVHGMVR